MLAGRNPDQTKTKHDWLSILICIDSKAVALMSCENHVVPQNICYGKMKLDKRPITFNEPLHEPAEIHLLLRILTNR